MFERSIGLKHVHFLVNNKLLDVNQHGFLAGKSVITVRIKFVNSIINSVYKVYVCCWGFRGYDKCFSWCIKLLSSIHSLGIQGRTLNNIIHNIVLFQNNTKHAENDSVKKHDKKYYYKLSFLNTYLN